MNRRLPSRSRSRSRSVPKSSGTGPFVAFLLIASFGILFAGCGSSVKGPNDMAMEDTTFTADDMAQFRQLTDEDGGTGSTISIGTAASREGVAELPAMESGAIVLDPALAAKYAAIRSMTSDAAELYRVTNDFLNVRSAPSTTAGSVGRLTRGEAVNLVEFPNAQWAKITMPSGTEGYVASRYISKLLSEDAVAAEEKKYENLYFVNYGFVNVRAEPNIGSEKIGEIPGQAFVRPVSMENGWAKVAVDGKEGFASAQFLKQFRPNLIVRQDAFTLPVLHYDLEKVGMLEALLNHAETLRRSGVKLITLRDFYDLLMTQEQRDVRLQSKSVVIAVSGVTRENASQVSTALRSKGVPATFFLQTKDIGISGISEKMLLTFQANGFDIQSAGHTGDDLRSLTSAQLKLELQQSRLLLEDMTNKSVFAVLYPQGGVNSRVEQSAQNAGYLFGVSAVPDKRFARDELLRIPSMTISDVMTAEDTVQAVE